ncbi:hypothetical protein Goshw_019026 [Gossypium schwendimanii]|uniref:Uncharacterized protein n=1 Tax=Gossypium schwendimanii TaxID=34291 RepID=A0A7J9M532_GOSSC|nr:hypothetical protein [Gossypium schwendimanii]
MEDGSSRIGNNPKTTLVSLGIQAMSYEYDIIITEISHGPIQSMYDVYAVKFGAHYKIPPTLEHALYPQYSIHSKSLFGVLIQGSKMSMILIAYITLVASVAMGLREDQGAVAPSPMESGGVALGVPAALAAALASMLAFGCFF